MTARYTPIKDIPLIVSELRANFHKHTTIPLDYRIGQLLALKKLFVENSQAIIEAVRADLHMDYLLARNEVQMSTSEVDAAVSALASWAKNQDASDTMPSIVLPASAYIHKDPLGVVLIISPWNFPVSLITRPLVGAIAAGNCVVIKPSEVSENVAGVLAPLLTRYMDQKTIRVVQGAVAESTALLKERFDKICYTGNGTVAKVVMRAAAEHLTPVLLELGGKCPCIIDDTIDLNVAVPRIAWGKWSNTGQICLAPDYVLCPRDRIKPFISLIEKKIRDFYGANPKESPDYGRIITQRHAQRIADLMNYGTIVIGGEVDIKERYVSPTVLTEPNLNSPLMQDEIFGPLLPIIPIDNLDDAIRFVNDRPKPLAVYIFTAKNSNAEKVLRLTASGGACVNDVILHNVCPDLPFGGVGDSGQGSYNGKQSFDTFSHQKSVLHKTTLADPSIRFPPYNPKTLNFMQSLSKIQYRHIKWFFIGLALAVLGIMYAYFFL